MTKAKTHVTVYDSLTMAFSLFFSGKISVKTIPFGLVKNTFYSRSCTYMDITITIIDSVPKEIDQPYRLHTRIDKIRVHDVRGFSSSIQQWE